MSGEKDTAVSKNRKGAKREEISVRKSGGKQKWQERWQELTGKMTFRLFLLLIGCGFLTFGTFWFLMQYQVQFYVNLVKSGCIEFDAKQITEDMKKKAENIRFADYSQKELMDYLEIEKYDDGYTSIIFYDEEGQFQFYALDYSVSETSTCRLEK